MQNKYYQLLIRFLLVTLQKNKPLKWTCKTLICWRFPILLLLHPLILVTFCLPGCICRKFFPWTKHRPRAPLACHNSVQSNN